MVSGDKKRVDAFEMWCYRRRLGVMENEQMGVGEDWVCFDDEKEYGGEEDEVIWPHCPEERYGEKTAARADGRQAEKGQTSNDLVPGFERMDRERARERERERVSERERRRDQHPPKQNWG